MANNPLVGAWELVSDSDAGILIYTGSLCVLVGSPRTVGGRPAIRLRPMKRLRRFARARLWLAPTLCPAPESPTRG